MICKMGWEFLSSNQNEQSKKDEIVITRHETIESRLFFPITFPVTTGAGTISVLFTLSAHSANTNVENYLSNSMAILLAIIIMCILVYFFYLNTKKIINYLGSNGENIINRITSFLIFCVGLQIAITGITTLVKNFNH